MFRQLSGVSGEGDRQADERSPFSQAFFTHKPPAVPLWLAAIETGLPSESTQPSKPVAEADAANSPQVPQSVPQQPSAISTDSTKVKLHLCCIPTVKA